MAHRRGPAEGPCESAPPTKPAPAATQLHTCASFGRPTHLLAYCSENRRMSSKLDRCTAVSGSAGGATQGLGQGLQRSAVCVRVQGPSTPSGRAPQGRAACELPSGQSLPPQCPTPPVMQPALPSRSTCQPHWVAQPRRGGAAHMSSLPQALRPAPSTPPAREPPPAVARTSRAPRLAAGRLLPTSGRLPSWIAAVDVDAMLSCGVGCGEGQPGVEWGA